MLCLKPSTESMACRLMARMLSRSRVEFISEEICWMMRTSSVLRASSAFSRSMTFWFSTIWSRTESSGSCSAAIALSGRRLLTGPGFPHRQYPIHIGRAQLEHAAHASHRCNRLQLHIHLVEQRAVFLRMVVLQLQMP